MRARVVGIVGGSSVSREVLETARLVGKMVAKNQWILVNGGRMEGVMDASAAGAAAEGGLVIGILPGAGSAGASGSLTVSIVTGMGDARNCIIALTSEVIIAFPGRGGTLSEIAMALKNNRPVVCLGIDPGISFNEYRKSGILVDARSPQDAIEKVKHFFRVTSQQQSSGPSFLRD
ncbi:MAG: DNA-binding protein [Candidatus Wallbacteria bacterium HGW-Wallbacteria-1]|jgi:hypothetical protein|uniref:DNA-binding protein n=1 Tax=Candidatus Wallbacteria bacterium HGW-Wallbacteria-1 TaxID=2013854 RepID=A0A2N1PMQ3_9BACT|nr:MAG: DNA-binding protein [Candidatus Wallbacteria bacterium HGW-Wallbacteria-1]